MKYCETIHDAIVAGLWPASKTITSEPGIPEIEALDYHRFYIGKNADLYFSAEEPPKVLMFRTDRASIFDIPLSEGIEGKGEIQNLISLLGAKFANSRGIRTCNSSLPPGFPEKYRTRTQIVELCKALTITFDNPINIIHKGKNHSIEGEHGTELIYRNYATGSLVEGMASGENPYKIALPLETKEWDLFDSPLFTPTTKGKSDLPFPSALFSDEYPEITQTLRKLFNEFSEYAWNKGLVIIDTKFEVFIDSNGDWCLGDEILTPESSRFILLEDFKAGNYKSADKQILREYGKKNNWKEKWATEQEYNPEATCLQVPIPANVAQQVIDGYFMIYSRLNS